MLQLDPAIIGKFPNIVVVMHEEVQHHAMIGYTLLAICEEQKIERPFDRYGQRPSDPDARVLTTALFVMGRSEDSAIAELTMRHERESKNACDANEARMAAEKKLRATELDLAQAKSKLADANADVSTLRTMADQRNVRLQKMEADLAKLRTAFGSRACDEALGVE